MPFLSSTERDSTDGSVRSFQLASVHSKFGLEITPCDEGNALATIRIGDTSRVFDKTQLVELRRVLSEFIKDDV